MMKIAKFIASKQDFCLLQHLQTTKGSHKMDYYVIGAANFVEYNKEHAKDVPDGSSKFFWAEPSNLGGFAYFEATTKNMTFMFVDGVGKRLYQHDMYPRQNLHQRK